MNDFFRQFAITLDETLHSRLSNVPLTQGARELIVSTIQEIINQYRPIGLEIYLSGVENVLRNGERCCRLKFKANQGMESWEYEYVIEGVTLDIHINPFYRAWEAATKTVEVETDPIKRRLKALGIG